MKYLSIDLETTGLDPENSDILEMAAVLDSLPAPNPPWPPHTPVDRLPYFRAVIIKDRYQTDAYCASLHKRLWDEIKAVDKTRIKGEGQYLGRWDGINKLWEDESIADKMRESTGPLTIYCDPNLLICNLIHWLHEQGIEKSIYPAGKNFGSFDLQFLKALQAPEGEYAERLPFKHRTFDPGSMYFVAGDTDIPDLTECLRRANLTPEGLHGALGDARDVVRLIRYKLVGQI